MKSIGFIFIFCLILVSAQSQTSTKESLVGCWQPVSVTCEDPNASVQESNDELKSQQFCFEAEGRFKVMYKKGTKMQTRVTGTYTVSKDGKKVTMKADPSEGSGEEWGEDTQIGEIVLLFGDRLSMNTDGCTMNFQRLAK